MYDLFWFRIVVNTLKRYSHYASLLRHISHLLGGLAYSFCSQRHCTLSAIHTDREGLMMVSKYRSLLINLCSLSVLAALTACGGGGGGGSSSSPSSFSVSGTIQIPTASLADDDSPQPGVSLITENNTATVAQPITNPSMVGGYVSSGSGLYNERPFRYGADESDYYSVSLLKDQVISLTSYTAESTPPAFLENVTLRLIAEDGFTIIDEVVANPFSKSITVATSGNYYIQIRSDEGPVLYLLTVSQGLNVAGDTLIAAAKTPSMAADFVPGEVMIKLKEEGGGFSAKQVMSYSQANQKAQGRLEKIAGLAHKGGSAKHGMRMKIDLSLARTNMRKKSSVDLSGWPPEMQEKWETLSYIESLKTRDDVEWAEPNYIRKAFANETDNPLYSSQWHYPLINVPAAWGVADGAGVIVAVIDTGIASSHKDLEGNITPGYDFISSVAISGDGDGIDPDPQDEGGSFHGSHVAGTVAALNNTVGGVGVAYGASIMPLRVLGVDGSGSDADIAQAILFAARESNASNALPTQSAAIINLSLGGPGFSSSLQSAVNAAVAKGIIIIAAAGNESSAAPSYPAAFPNVISVSAVDQAKALAPYSNSGSTISVAAPGGNMQQDINGDGNVDGVLSTVNASAYAWFQGTSMAAPHVAGVAALMKSVDNSVNAVSFKSMLETGLLTDDLGLAGRDDAYGFGLINASKALTAANEDIPAFLSINPQSLSFDGLDETTLVTMQQGGSLGVIEITNVTDVDNSTMLNANWLSVTKQSAGGGSLGTYRVSIDRTGLDINTTLLGTINIAYTKDGNPQTPKQISVLMRVPDPSEVATVGTLFVGLIERATQEEAEAALEQDERNVLIEIFLFQQATEEQGVYTYAFEDVPPGDYYVFASTNMDDDGVVSDLGEAQGEFPVVGDATLITVTDANIPDLDFTVGYLNLVGELSTEDNQKQRIIRRIPDSYLEQKEQTETLQIKRLNQ